MIYVNIKRKNDLPYNIETYRNIDNFLLWFFKNRDLTKVKLPKELQRKLFKY